MTIQLEIKNKNQGGEHSVRVHKCYMTAEGLHVEDPVVIGPGASTEFTIWKDVKLAIEEEGHEAPVFIKADDPVCDTLDQSAYNFERDGEIGH